MATKTKRAVKTGLATAPIPIADVSGKMPNFHHELGTGTTDDGRRMRFLQHINGACFWLQIGDEMYQLSTQDIMNAMATACLATEFTP